jgi:glycerol uptake facilitator-like aquaporin
MNKYLVEFLGTLLLVFTIVATGNWAAIGAALAIIVLLGGPISGGAYNPAVAISLYSNGALAKQDVLPYIIVEILGGLTAVFLYNKFVKNQITTN